MTVEQQIGQAVSTAIRNSVFLARESKEDVFALHARAAMSALAPFVDELERFREHSITLNTIGWKLAVALGDVPEGADQTTGNPIEQAERLIGQRDDALRTVQALMAERPEICTCPGMPHDPVTDCPVHPEQLVERWAADPSTSDTGYRGVNTVATELANPPDASNGSNQETATT